MMSESDGIQASFFIQRSGLLLRAWIYWGTISLLLLSGVSAHAIDISSIEELQKIGNDAGYPLNGNYVLTQDLDASETAGWADGAGFDPIGDANNGYNNYFAGTFDGQGHVISGLVINRPGENTVGLFGAAWNGEIKNLGLVGGFVTGNTAVGALAGSSYSTLSSCYATCTVSGGDAVGGLAGLSIGNSVNLCHAAGAVTGNIEVGGLIGVLQNGRANFCYAVGAVTGSNCIGGLIGNMDSISTVNCCYARGSVAGGNIAGGLVGGQMPTSGTHTVSSSYATGKVTGTDNLGGLIAWGPNFTVTNSYWNVQTVGLDSSDGGEGRNTVDMTEPHGVNTYVDWDFETVWAEDTNHTLNDGYPYLLASPPSPPAEEGEGEAEGEGEGEVPTEGEGELPAEGEGEILPEGEGEVFSLMLGLGTVSPEYVHGTITPDPEPIALCPPLEGQPWCGLYPAGTEVHLTPVPNEDYEFDHWTEDLSGSDVPGTVVMDANKHVKAEFIAVSEGEGEVVEGEGEILPEGEGEILPEGEGETPTEGEGEVPTEGEIPVEGEVSVEGEGELPVEGEGEGEDEPCGCCNSTDKKLTPKDLFDRTLGDWLVIGMTLMALTALTYFVKK